jgi:hypothetical protein
MVTGGGTVPFPPLAHPPASAKLISATTNRQFFIMISSLCEFRIEASSFEPIRKESVAQDTFYKSTVIWLLIPILEQSYFHIHYSNQQVTNVPDFKGLVCAGGSFA